jgi:hypothetical protein
MFLLDERIFGCFGKLSVMGCLAPQVVIPIHGRLPSLSSWQLWKSRSAANPDMIFANPVCWPGDATWSNEQREVLPPLGVAAAELVPKFFDVIHTAA